MARTHKAALDDVLERFKDTSDARAGIEEVWIDNYRKYRGIDPNLEQRRKENLSALFIPRSFEKVETITPRLVRSLLSERPWVRVRPRTVDHDYNRAAAMQTLLDYQFAEKMNFYKTLEDVVRDSQIYGIAPVQMGWRRKVRKRKRREMTRTQIEGNEIVRLGDVVSDEYVLYNGPWATAIDPFGFYWDSFATSMEDCDFIITQTFRNNRWIKEQFDQGVYKRNKNAALQGSLPQGLPAWLDERRQITGWQNNWRSRSDLHEVLELWTPEWVITVIDRETVVRNEETPFWHGELPFAVATDTQLAQEFAGLGLILPMADLQEEINAKRNQRMDNVNLALNQAFTILNTSSLEEDQVRLSPGKLIPVDSHDELKPLEVGEPTRSGYEEEDRVDRDIQATTGVWDYSAGATPQRRETATGIVSLQTASDEKFRLKVNRLANDVLIPLYRQAAALNQQMLTATEYIGLMGPAGFPLVTPVNPEDIAGEFEFMFDGSTIDTVADRQFKLNQMIQLLPVLDHVEGVNKTEFVRMILQMAEVPNIDVIIPPEGGLMETLMAALGGGLDMGMGGGPPPMGVPNLPNESMDGVGMAARIGPTPFEMGSVM